MIFREWGFGIWIFQSVRCMEFCLSESFQYRAFPAPCMAWTLIYTLRRIQTPQTYILFIYMLSDTSSRYLRTNQDNSRHHQTPTDTKRHQQTSPDTQKGRSRMCGGSCWHGMAFAGVCWCLMVSVSVLCCLEMWRGCLRSFSKRIWVLFMDVCTVSLRLRVYLSVLALYGAANALYWKSSERQNSTHLTLLKHQNTKTSLYKLSKNHWVIAFFKNFGSVRKKLQFTVLLDHPVAMNGNWYAIVLI